MEEKKCPECGTLNSGSATVCANCGYPFIQKEKRGLDRNRIIGIALLIVAIICFSKGFQFLNQAKEMTENNSSLDFYRSHYVECEAGYNENIATAQSPSGFRFRSDYEYIAREYKRMMEDDQKKIDQILDEANGFRIKAMGISGAGAICAVVGLLMILRKRRA